MFELYFEACLDSAKREKFESKLQSEVADSKKKETKEEKSEEDEKETDADIAKRAKSNAKDDDEFEKEVEKEIEAEKKTVKKPKKILLGIILKDVDGEIGEAIIGETDLVQKEIEGLEYKDEVSKAMYNMKTLKTPAQIAKRIKELKGSIVYYYDEDKRNNDKEFWTVVKI